MRRRNPWALVDAIGYWIVEELSARAQLRMGVVLFIASLPFYPYMIWSGEPPVIYFLSVLAVTLTGLTLLIGVQVLVLQERAQELADAQNGADPADDPSPSTEGR